MKTLDDKEKYYIKRYQDHLQDDDVSGFYECLIMEPLIWLNEIRDIIQFFKQSGIEVDDERALKITYPREELMDELRSCRIPQVSTLLHYMMRPSQDGAFEYYNHTYRGASFRSLKDIPTYFPQSVRQALEKVEECQGSELINWDWNHLKPWIEGLKGDACDILEACFEQAYDYAKQYKQLSEMWAKVDHYLDQYDIDCSDDPVVINTPIAKMVDCIEQAPDQPDVNKLDPCLAAFINIALNSDLEEPNTSGEIDEQAFYDALEEMLADPDITEDLWYDWVNEEDPEEDY